MDRLTFQTHRVGFLELPATEREICLAQVRAGAGWWFTFDQAAERLRALAQDIHRQHRQHRQHSAAEAWLWAAAAFQASSLGWHLDDEADGDALVRAVLRQRRRAMHCYRRALGLNPRFGEPLELSLDEAGPVRGYLRRPRDAGAPLVVLVNGLDSLCEAELHAFGDRLLDRGMAVLALDLPAAFGSRLRRPRHRLEKLAGRLVEVVAQHGDFGPAWGAFGVSFGGYLAARLMAGEAQFAAAVAVSPPAWISPRLRARRRFRRMLQVGFDPGGNGALGRLAAAVGTDGLEPPAGRLLVFQMEQDELFGAAHAQALRDWAGGGSEVRRVAAEHVGTSRIHQWLPEACDWLGERLRPQGQGGGSWR